MSIASLRKGMIDLGRGHPSTSLLATKEVAAASAAVFERFLSDPHLAHDDDRHPLQYGTDPGPISVRQTFASWLSRMYHTQDQDPDRMAVTCGASFGLANTCLQMTDPLYTRRVFMITPAYFLAARIFQDAGYGDKMYAVDEENADGPDIEQLRRVLEEDARAPQEWLAETKFGGKRYKYLFYGVPTFSNPSGIVWSLAKRKALLELARKYDILIITDEVYDFLDYSDEDLPPIARMLDLDLESGTTEYGNTISNMSFSKYLGPGLRIGTIQTATKKLVEQWSSGGANHSGGMMSQHTSYYIAELISNGSIDGVLQRLNSVYSERSRVMLQTLREKMPAGTKIFGGSGGYFIWFQLPASLTDTNTAEEVLAIARTDKFGVHALSGSAFEVPGHERGWGRQFLRLSLSFMDKDEARRGIELLAQAVTYCMSTR